MVEEEDVVGAEEGVVAERDLLVVDVARAEVGELLKEEDFLGL